MTIIDKIRERLLLRRERQNEYESQALRRHFASRYDITIGLYSYGCFDRWRIPPGSVIGRYCSIAKTARILDANHPIDALSTHPYFYDPSFGIVRSDRTVKTRIVIEDGVWISHNATITPGCGRIGRGAIIGAGAVVTKDVPPYAILAGAPARVVRLRFSQATIDRIEESCWWELDKTALSQLVAERPDFVFAPASAAA
ncbi:MULTISPECIES: CatB-related O-acetyltransferase [unclassified Methylobacterium]|uniref:CatB-related O-acetyltransferase n=1 Tax=unclassified Methylobacterium TaxID=2615210 RepID=UPI0006F740D4|nr:MULTISPECIES: CatB-related O-acetyltransferase [unclassified Methylobacterium]KQO62505.1 chloramphenicol acetyltransferase [Methylobacterium sp. Leaf88]KQU19698.1 chloramphenicol acetyltransferase [Methylobacterium sp. Leaf94]